MPGNPGRTALINSKRRLPLSPPSGDEWLITFQNHPCFEKLVYVRQEITIDDGISIADDIKGNPAL